MQGFPIAAHNPAKKISLRGQEISPTMKNI